MNASRIRLRDVTVDLATGAVDAPAPDGGRRTTRLAPQPTVLLRMLVARGEELVPIDEIRQALWPDVQVEFDNSMHACVRQIRGALGDSASNPRFIETLPRRGYRLLAPVVTIDARPAAAAAASASAPQRPRRRLAIAPVVALTALLGAATVLAVGMQGHAGPARRTIAIMPFDAPAEFPGHAEDVATALTARLGRDPAWAVIGPSTTARFRDRAAPVAAAGAGLDVDYVVNARFADRDGRLHMLVEIIRATDGVHTWVSWFDATSQVEDVAAQVVAGLGRADGAF